MRIALVYDCLYPYTVGGAERWYRSLAERLAEAGHEVTYLTLSQWDPGSEPRLPGVAVAAVGPRMALYSEGRRRVLPPIVFGLGVFAHLLRFGRRYDVVHTASFPYFSLLAAATIRPLHRYRLVVDWIEVWTREYWREYLGWVGGRFGWWVQRLCAGTKHRAFALAALHAKRLRELGFRGEITVLGGLFDGSRETRIAHSADPVVVFAGRHIREKQVPAIVPAIARAREKVPQLRGELYGEGPQRDEVLQAIEQHDLTGAVEAPGFVAAERVANALAGAVCLVLPSRREGYGLVVVEAASVGTPSVVVRGADNAATDLVEDGVNGIIAASISPEELASAIIHVYEAGPALRRSTATWFAQNVERLSLDASLRTVLAAYEDE
jgi:glycosyltransferase involved in cell wall biosynthesis